MDLSTNPTLDARDVECPEHGMFTSRRLSPLVRVWSRCPRCTEVEDRAAVLRQEQEAREESERRHRAMLDKANIPARFFGRSFDNFEATTPPQVHALTVARDFAEQFEERQKQGAGLIFSGKPGTGKSHLAAAILQALLSPNVRYMTCMDLIRAVRETWRRDSEQSEGRLLAYLENLDLLVIDEVGMQYGTDGEQTILFDVLDRRYREVRPVILLTNQDKTGFKGFVGDRTYDRLTETAKWVPFDWESHRPKMRRGS